MATRRLRLTGFARFLIVMIFLVPIAYLGASYYNGQDGIQNIKDFFGIQKSQPATERVEVNRNVQEDNQTLPSDSDKTVSNTNVKTNSSLDSRRLDQLEKRMNAVEQENARLREQIQALKQQLN